MSDAGGIAVGAIGGVDRASATTIERTVVPTRDWEFHNDYNVQLHPDTLERHFPDRRARDPLAVRNEGSPARLVPETFGRIQERDIGEDEVGIGINMRTALGVDVGETVVLSDGLPVEFEKSLRQDAFDRLVDVRPVLCRTQASVLPDPGFDVCRLSPSTMGLLGIEEGDKVVVETPGAYVKVRAFAIDDEIRERIERTRAADALPDCQALLAVDRFEPADLPTVLIDAENREKLGLGAGMENLCQPVRVYRDSIDLFAHSFHSLTTPVVISAGIIVFGFDFLEPGVKALVVAVGVLWAAVAAVYENKRSL